MGHTTDSKTGKQLQLPCQPTKSMSWRAIYGLEITILPIQTWGKWQLNSSLDGMPKGFRAAGSFKDSEQEHVMSYFRFNRDKVSVTWSPVTLLLNTGTFGSNGKMFLFNDMVKWCSLKHLAGKICSNQSQMQWWIEGNDHQEVKHAGRWNI